MIMNKLLSAVIIFTLVLTGDSPSHAAYVTFPEMDVPATGVAIPFQTDREWLPTDTLDLTAEGTTCTLLGCEVRDNAAGIISFGGFGPGFEVGNLDALVYSYAEGAHQGALILSMQPLLDGDRPWIQLIRPTVENGLGASVVPSTVHSRRTLAEYGGFLAEPIPAGTTLYLATADINHGDNSGSYHVSTAVPEPSTSVLLILGLFASQTICGSR